MNLNPITSPVTGSHADAIAAIRLLDGLRPASREAMLWACARRPVSSAFRPRRYPSTPPQPSTSRPSPPPPTCRAVRSCSCAAT